MLHFQNFHFIQKFYGKCYSEYLFDIGTLKFNARIGKIDLHDELIERNVLGN